MITLAKRTLALFGILSVVLGVSARAAEVETGPAPVCDTQAQVERLASLFGGDAQSAIHAVNAEVRDPRACGLANLAYLRGARVGTVRTLDATFEIVEVLVVGVVSQTGVRATRPAVYFSLLKIDERAA